MPAPTTTTPRVTRPRRIPRTSPNVIDGDPGTVWTTQTYDQNFGPGGIKDGVGVLLDLGEDQAVGEVRDRLRRRADRGVCCIFSDEAPSGVPTGEPVAEDTADQRRLTLSLPDDASGRYLLVWLTSLPSRG